VNRKERRKALNQKVLFKSSGNGSSLKSNATVGMLCSCDSNSLLAVDFSRCLHKARNSAKEHTIDRGDHDSIMTASLVLRS